MNRIRVWFTNLYPVWLVGRPVLALSASTGGIIGAVPQIVANLGRLVLAAQPLAAVPAVFSGVMQNVLGGPLASWWKSCPPAKDDPKAR